VPCPAGTTPSHPSPGASGGLPAVEHLRQIFGELQAHTVRDCVSFPRHYEHFTDTGTWQAPEHHQAAAKVMLDELHWWAEILHDVRRKV
jgi:NAD(P)H-dependent FMN reductase